MQANLRRPSPRRLAAGLALVTTGALTLAAGASWGGTAASVPKRSQPVTIGYAGTFSLSNVAVPQRAAHSYVFKVHWRYWWTGSWSGLFRNASSTRGAPVRFSSVEVTGTLQASYRATPDGPVVECAKTIGPDAARRPTLAAALDVAADRLRVRVEAPTLRGIDLAGPDPQCIGGPGVNLRGAPKSFDPRGQDGNVRMSTGGRSTYWSTWSWRHDAPTVEGPTDHRRYKAAIRTDVTVAYKPCRAIPSCARAVPGGS